MLGYFGFIWGHGLGQRSGQKAQPFKLDPNHNDEIGLEQIWAFWVGMVMGSEHGLVLERARILD